MRRHTPPLPAGTAVVSGWVAEEFGEVIFPAEPFYYDLDQFVAIALFLADIGQGFAPFMGEYVTFDLEASDYVGLTRAAREYGLPWAHWLR